MSKKKTEHIRWVDETSYSRGERGNVEPRCWALSVGRWLFLVHKHKDWGEEWLFTCRHFGIEHRELGTTVATKAKRKAAFMILRESNRFLHESTGNLLEISSAFFEREEDFFFFESYKEELENG